MVLDYCNSEPEFFLCVIFCVCLLFYASLRLLHLTVAQILYTIISYLYRIYLLLKFLHVLTEFNTAFGSCGCFNLPIVRSQRQLILKHTLACTCIALFLGSLLCPRSTVGSTECGHSGLNCTPRRAPAPRYIVAFNVYLPKPLGCLPLKCLPQTGTTRINDGHASYFVKAPCFFAPQR